MFGGNVRSALVHALTQFDARNERAAAKKGSKRYHNAYALAQYLNRIDDVMADIERGATPRDACCAAFTGLVLKSALKAIEAPEASRDELSGLGKFTYVPASQA